MDNKAILELSALDIGSKIKSGEIVVDNNSDMADPSKAGLEHVTFVK